MLIMRGPRRSEFYQSRKTAVKLQPLYEKRGRHYKAYRPDKLWTDDHIKQLLEKALKHLQLPPMLALWTGQR